MAVASHFSVSAPSPSWPGPGSSLVLIVCSLFPRLFIPHSHLPHPTQPTCLIAWVLIKHGMISEGIILVSPNDFLHLFSTYFLTQHYDFRPKHVALCLSTSFPLLLHVNWASCACLICSLHSGWFDCLRLPALPSILSWTFPPGSPHGAACDWLWVQTPRQECWVKNVWCLLIQPSTVD